MEKGYIASTSGIKAREKIGYAMGKRSPLRQTLPPLLCLAAFFVLFAFVNFVYLPRFIDGDIYADMQLAREIWRQKTFFPSNWIYGNQYYTVATPVLAALFFGLTGSMNLSMSLATTCMSALLVWSFLWMLRPFEGRPALRLSALLLFVACPMANDLLREPQGQLFFTLASYYACYLITLCLVFGDYARAILQPEQGFRPLPFLLSLALSFLTGMQSLRQTLIMVLPLLALEALRLLLRRSSRAGLLRALAYALANLLGLGLIKLLRIPARTIYGQVELGGGALGDRLLADWHAVRGITGLDTALFDPPKAFFLLFFALTVLLVPAAALLLWKRRKERSGLALLWLLCAVSLFGTLLAGLIVQIRMREIYLFLWYLLVALSLLPLLDALGDRGKTLSIALLCLLSLANLIFSYGSSLSLARERDPAPALAFCRDAEAAGIEYVYGDWSNVPGLLVWSDGKITGGFWDEIIFLVRDTINLQDIYTEDCNDKALYVLGIWGRGNFDRYCHEMGGEYEVFGEYGDWIAYKTDKQLMNFGAKAP